MFDVFLLKATVISLATLLQIYLVLIFFLLTLSLDVTDDVHHMVKSALDNEDRLGKFLQARNIFGSIHTCSH